VKIAPREDPLSHRVRRRGVLDDNPGANADDVVVEMRVGDLLVLYESRRALDFMR